MFAVYKWPSQITGPNAGGPVQFPIMTPSADRVGQFWSLTIQEPTMPDRNITAFL